MYVCGVYVWVEMLSGIWYTFMHRCLCLSASAWKVMQLTLGVFLHHFHIGKLISGAPRALRFQQVYWVYPEIPFICIPSDKIAAKPAQFFTHLTIWVVVLTLVENTLHWAIFPTLSLLMLPSFGQFLFVLGKERRKFQWTYWFPSDIESLYQGYDLNI